MDQRLNALKIGKKRLNDYYTIINIHHMIFNRHDGFSFRFSKEKKIHEMKQQSDENDA